jgi:hypothetical protein
MDFVNKLTGGSGNKEGEQQQSYGNEGQKQESSGGFMDKLNGMAGGGKESEKNEDGLDKGMSFSNHFPISSSYALTSNHGRCVLTLVIVQESTGFSRTSSARATRATRAPPSRLRTSRSPTSSVASTRVPLAPTSPSRIRNDSRLYVCLHVV